MSTRWIRRARPFLGTLVEVGIRATAPSTDEAAITAAFDAIEEVQRCLSRFDAQSDIARFNAAPAGTRLPMRASTAQVLGAAASLCESSDGLFDITLGSGAGAWQCADGQLHKATEGVRIDLGGIGKGHAVDAAVDALRDHGCEAGWVNAGGDLRAFGGIEIPIGLRDEGCGGSRPFAALADGAFATSRFAADSRAQLADRCNAAGAAPRRRTSAMPDRASGRMPLHASVAAPLCLWADALTKVVALSGDPRHPALRRHDARAWLHDAA